MYVSALAVLVIGRRVNKKKERQKRRDDSNEHVRATLNYELCPNRVKCNQFCDVALRLNE